MAAAIEVFKFQHSLEIDAAHNTKSDDTKISYNIESNDAIGGSPMTFSGSATLPISVTLNDGILQSEGAEYLGGSL
ncbi:MAG: hypothetical protein F6K54_27995 [Okeania sp. SIO3B5]|uniref:hypothetical protein n=1 Tax=Okeania sp. SIO3B5 TaxID=2607811 RepID=UPI0013FF1C8E|nr:hypothetical protein [Okeania sp. SIO3B5]NEO56580.1 hypothetical protein [Okeania sp. SIO3B5]